MVRHEKVVFVLWGTGCDELAAVTFVITLRATGIAAKLVGVSGRQVRGAHGLALTPDYTLSQAVPLAHQAACLVLPCPAGSLVRFTRDPRLREFLRQSQHHQARVLCHDQHALDKLHELGLIAVESTYPMSIYPRAEKLLAFVTALGLALPQSW